MKKLFLLFTFIFLFTNLHAQQEEYTEFLQNAMNAIDKWDRKEFELNIRYFVTALDRDKITPETLTKENFDLLSECIFSGIGSEFITAENLKTDIVSFLKYDIENHPANMGVLGSLYLAGTGVEQDFEKARSWFERGVEQNDAWCNYKLGIIYSSGILGVEKDMEKTRSYYQKAAELGNANAAGNLASYYMNGKLYGWKTDIPKAIELYKQAIEKADDYQKGDYMFQLAEAENWYRKSIEQYEQQAGKGNILAMYTLGIKYKIGNGVKQNSTKAKEWYQKACEAGFEVACQSYETLK